MDLISLLGTAGGSSGLTGLLVYLLTRRNGNGHSPSESGDGKALQQVEQKIDKLIESQQQTNMLLAEIKGVLSYEH